MRWLNKSIAIINITLQLLDVYKKTESHYPSKFEFVLSKFRINPIKSILNQYKKIKKKTYKIFKIMACLDCRGGGGVRGEKRRVGRIIG